MLGWVGFYRCIYLSEYVLGCVSGVFVCWVVLLYAGVCRCMYDCIALCKCVLGCSGVYKCV